MRISQPLVPFPHLAVALSLCALLSAQDDPESKLAKETCECRI